MATLNGKEAPVNCEEFKRRLNLVWDARYFPPLPADIEAHIRACESCRRYADDMRKMNALLFDRPEPVMPPGLQQRLYAMAVATEVRNKDLSWKPYVFRGLALVVPAAILCIPLFPLPVPIRLWINAVISLLAMGVSLFYRMKFKTAIVKE